MQDNPWAGPNRARVCLMGVAANIVGRAEAFDNLVDRVGLGREKMKSDGPGRAAARPLNV